jgi:hypothetical protein
MDKVGIQQLIRVGVNAARARIRNKGAAEVGLGEDPQFSLILDRLTQTGLIFLEHGIREQWMVLVDGLQQIYRALLPPDPFSEHVPSETAVVLMMVIQRVYTLGAFAVVRGRYEELRYLALQHASAHESSGYWARHAVTMAARGAVENVFKAHSLIGPASDVVRGRPEFFEVFDQNLDTVVDSMCQFDFLQCLLIINETGDRTDCYPNFGGYWNHRTLPIIRQIVTGGKPRQLLGDTPDENVAELIRELDSLAAQSFFRVNGWRSSNWDFPEIEQFLHRFRPQA